MPHDDTHPVADKASLAFRCVDLQASSDVEELQAMVDRARNVSFDTFARHVDWKPTARLMGYATEKAEPGMQMEGDRCVSFHSSTWRGEPVYYLVHSAIEFVFRKQAPHKAIRPADAWGGMEMVDTSAQAPRAPASAPRARRSRP
tara:strand:- start:171 stop:605 length:435 start_codon:yes stop_codon:yes gene_type:complete